jgi:hypothetical protein
MASPSTLQDDPDLVLPPAVRAQAERATAIVNAMNQPPVADSEPQPVEVVAELEVPPAPPVTDPPAEPVPVVEPPAPPAPPVADNDWEHKYNSMHGRFMRASDQVRELTDQVMNLQNVLATMTQAPTAADIPVFKAEKLVTEEEERDYGTDMLQVVGKKAREELGPIIAPLLTQLEVVSKQVQNLNGARAADQQGTLLATLDQKMPQWRELNTNSDFLSWLGLPDPFSGAIRHDMLKAAYSQGNANRVLAFFNGFLAEEAATAPVSEPQPDPAATRVAQIPLVELAAPGRAKTAATGPVPAEKPVFTRAQIATFYANVAAGKYRGRDADKVATEKQIFSAQAEGRIR